jgi:carbonic anhydrase
MSLIAPAAELAGPPDGDGDYLTRLEQASIAKSLDNLLTFPYVAEAVRSGELFLHGAYFDVATGRMFVHDGIGYTPMKVEPASCELEQPLGEHGN